MLSIGVNQLDVTPESDSMQQMPDLVLKTGDARVDGGEPAAAHDISEDEDSWPSESSDEFDDEAVVTSSHPAPSKYSNREDVVRTIIHRLTVELRTRDFYEVIGAKSEHRYIRLRYAASVDNNINKRQKFYPPTKRYKVI